MANATATTYNIQFSALLPTNILVEAEEGLTKKELISRVSIDDLREAFLVSTELFEDFVFSWKQEVMKENITIEDEYGIDID